MSTEGHFCGPGACGECGERHGCICGNDCSETIRPAAAILIKEHNPSGEDLVAERISTLGQNIVQIERIESGININLNHEKFYTEQEF